MKNLEHILQAIFIYINKGIVEQDYYADDRYIYLGESKYSKYELEYELYKYISRRDPKLLYADLKKCLDLYYNKDYML